MTDHLPSQSRHKCTCPMCLSVPVSHCEGVFQGVSLMKTKCEVKMKTAMTPGQRRRNSHPNSFSGTTLPLRKVSENSE